MMTIRRCFSLLLALTPMAVGCGQQPFAPAQASTAAAQKPDAPAAVTPGTTNTMSQKIQKTEADWKAQLTPEQYRILRQKGTERAFTGKYWKTKDSGSYKCAGCGEVLFVSDTKYDSGCGWPSFFQPADAKKIDEHLDTTLGMVRTEVTCSKCGGHLGHVFEDGPKPTGLRYCINSASLTFEPKPKTPAAPEPKKP